MRNEPFNPKDIAATFDDDEVVFKDSDGSTESLPWSKLERVRIDVVEIAGQMIPYLILDTKKWNVYRHPGFIGEHDLHARLFMLPGFKRELFESLQSDAQEGTYEIWVRCNDT